MLAAGEGDRVELDVAPGCVREGSAVDADIAAEAVVGVLSASSFETLDTSRQGAAATLTMRNV